LVAALGSSCAQIIGLDDYEKVPDGGKGGNSTAGNSPEAGEGPETGGSMSTRGGKAGTSGGKAGSSGGKGGSIGGETGSAGEDPGTSGGTSNRGGNGNTNGGTLTLEGGSGGTGGAAGDDGSGGTTTTKGGTTSKGGTTGAGGSTSKGGTTSASGTTGKGGTTSAGGSTSKGGTTGTGGTCPQTELLEDGYFDEASPAWQEEYDSNSYPLIVDPTSSNFFYADTAPYVAWVGGVGEDDAPVLFSRVLQQVRIPASATAVDFECLIWIDSADSATVRRDYLNIELLDTSENIVGSFGFVSNTDFSDDYVLYGASVSVSALSGDTVFFNMSAEQNASLPTDFVVDSCSLVVTACR